MSIDKLVESQDHVPILAEEQSRYERLMINGIVGEFVAETAGKLTVERMELCLMILTIGSMVRT